MNPITKNLIAIAVVVLGVAFLYNFSQPDSNRGTVPFSDFLKMLDGGRIDEVLIQGGTIYFYADNSYRGKSNQFKAVIPDYFYQNLVPTLMSKGVRFRVDQSDQRGGFFLALLSSWLPVILIVGVWLFFMRQMQGGGKLMSFGKSKARKIEKDKNKITFKDVAGVEEAKADLEEVVDFLKDPTKYEKLGGKIPKGVLLVGSPGTGKTLLAKAVAGEANASFFTISGSDFVEMFVGVGASRVRDLFQQARDNAPCIVFIDEIDAVGRHRGAGLGGGNDEREQTLNQLLVEMDGFQGNEGIIIVAATNRPDVLDPALTRPGRFDRNVVVPLPDLEGRKKILEVHAKKVQLNADVDLSKVARGTPGFSGADLANLINEGALLAARTDNTTVTQEHLEESRDKVMMGAQRKKMVISKEEKETTAYHEAGHAIVAALCKEKVDPIHKVTIIPRGRALGLTMLLPDRDQHSQYKSKLLSDLQMMMGGRAAEDLIFNHFTTGASNDLERATSIAHQMVCNWGMSDEMGPVYYSADQGEVFLGRDMMRKKTLSQHSAMKIDQEINKIVNTAYTKAKELLKSNLESLHQLAKLLIEKETVDGEDVIKIVEGAEIKPV